MAELAYFPTPRPGELVYSLAARFQRHLGISTSQKVNEVLFGESNQRPQYDLPARMGILADRIPPMLRLDAEKLINGHTLFPYYATFKSNEQVRKAWAAVVGDGASIASGFSALTFHRLRLKRLRFCRHCRDEMLAEFGEAYWHREHHLAAVLVCPVHGCDLLVSTVAAGAQARTYEAPTEDTCPAEATSCVPDLNEAQRNDLTEIAKDAVARLDPTMRLAFLEWRGQFHDLCTRKGLSFGAGRIRRETLIEAIEKRFGHLRSALPFVFDWNNEQTWLDGATRLGSKVSAGSPLGPHLLRETLKALPDQAGPFGLGPWPCLNPLGGHKGEQKISSYRIRNIPAGQYSAIFECACGYSYVRSTRSDGTFTKPSLKAYGPTLDPFVRLATIEGWQISTVARHAETSPELIRETAARLGLEDIWPRRKGKAGGARNTAGQFIPFLRRP